MSENPQRKLKKENEIIEQLNALVDHEDPAIAVQEAKKLQDAFKEIGHVPIKLKTRFGKIIEKYVTKFMVIIDRQGLIWEWRESWLEGLDPSARKEVISSQKKLDAAMKTINGIRRRNYPVSRG